MANGSMLLAGHRISLAFALLLVSTTVLAQGIAGPTRSNPAVATSSATTKSGVVYGPERLFDGRSDTAWCEGVTGDGVGESAAIFLGDAGAMGGPQDVVVTISRGLQRDYPIYKKTGRPTKLKVELLAGSKVLASGDVATEHAFSDITFPQVPAAKGSLWLKVTILAADPNTEIKSTCISEIRPSFKKANPNHVREFADRICTLILKPKTKETNRELNALVKKVRKYFTTELTVKPEYQCNMEFFSVLSDTEFEMWGAEEGDGATILRFRKKGIMWDLVTAGSFTVWD